MRAGTIVPSSAAKRTISGRIQGKDDHSRVGVSVTRPMDPAAPTSATKSSGGRFATSCTTARRRPSGESEPTKRPGPSVIRSRPEPSKSIQKRCSSKGEPSLVPSRKRDRSSGRATLSTSHDPLVSARLSPPSASTA